MQSSYDPVDYSYTRVINDSITMHGFCMTVCEVLKEIVNIMTKYRVHTITHVIIVMRVLSKKKLTSVSLLS